MKLDARAEGTIIYSIDIKAPGKLANLLKQQKIVICEGCESCLSEIAAYCWEESGTGRDRPKKERDHAMDEMRYFAVSIAKKERGGGIAMRAVERAAR